MNIEKKKTVAESAKEMNVAVGDEHLEALAKAINKKLDEVDACIWDVGELLSLARKYHNTNQHFGRWCRSCIMHERNQSTLYRYRLLHEVFGDKREEVKDVPPTALYELAKPKYKKVRATVIAAVNQEVAALTKASGEEEKASIAMVEDATKKYLPAPELKPEPAPEPASEPEPTPEPASEPEPTPEPVPEPEPSAVKGDHMYFISDEVRRGIATSFERLNLDEGDDLFEIIERAKRQLRITEV